MKKIVNLHIRFLINVISNTHANTIKNKINNYKLEEISYNANKYPIEKIKLNLINKLDKKLNLLDIDYCIIENQPSLKNH